MKTLHKPFADLAEDETPLYASVEIEGDRKKWLVEVPTEQGKAMEADGFDVGWVIATDPFETVAMSLDKLKGMIR